MATLHELQRSVFPAARPVGTADLLPEHAAQDVAWVRVLRPRVPAFDALERGDLAIIPGPALAVVAPDAARLDEVVRALVRARVTAVLLVEGDAGGTNLAALGDAIAAAGGVALALGRTDPAALERRLIGALIERPIVADPMIDAAAGRIAVDDGSRPAYRPAVDRLLRELAMLPDGAFNARELLAPIMVGSMPAQRRRLATLRAVLGSASHGEAAARLGIHRNTVAYRIARMEERAGWDLADPDLRLALQVALRLVQDAR
jgi:hypothetical protein